MAADKREALLDAAERAILSEGFAGASTRRIAQEAGVPLSLVHYHFGGKEGLLVALVERARDRGRAAVRAALTGEDQGAPRAAPALAVARATFFEGGASVQLNLELAVAALHNEPLRAEIQRLYADAIATLGRTAATVTAEGGSVGGTGPRPEAIASLLLAAGFGLALQRMLAIEVDAAGEGFDLLARLLLGRLAGVAGG